MPICGAIKTLTEKVFLDLLTKHFSLITPTQVLFHHRFLKWCGKEYEVLSLCAMPHALANTTK